MRRFKSSIFCVKVFARRLSTTMQLHFGNFLVFCRTAHVKQARPSRGQTSSHTTTQVRFCPWTNHGYSISCLFPRMCSTYARLSSFCSTFAAFALEMVASCRTHRCDKHFTLCRSCTQQVHPCHSRQLQSRNAPAASQLCLPSSVISST